MQIRWQRLCFAEVFESHIDRLGVTVLTQVTPERVIEIIPYSMYLRGIWIYMPPKGPHEQGGSDHPFGVCQVMSRHDGRLGKAPCTCTGGLGFETRKGPKKWISFSRGFQANYRAKYASYDAESCLGMFFRNVFLVRSRPRFPISDETGQGPKWRKDAPVRGRAKSPLPVP